MKRLFSFACLALLAGCGTASVVTYDAAFHVTDAGQQSELALATHRVIERRLEVLGEEAITIDVQPGADGASVDVEVDNDAVADALTEQLTREFSFEVMKEAPAETADITVEGHGGFARTGINGSHVLWITAAQDAAGNASVILNFSEEGRALMRTLFKENKGKYIGIFVRDILVSKLMVETDTLEDQIVIQGIPTPEFAFIFADDVNVGLHVTFTEE